MPTYVPDTILITQQRKYSSVIVLMDIIICCGRQTRNKKLQNEVVADALLRKISYYIREVSSIRNLQLNCWESIVHKGTEDSGYISTPESKAIFCGNFNYKTVHANSFKNKK